MKIAGLLVLLFLLCGASLAQPTRRRQGPQTPRPEARQQREASLPGDQLFQIHCRRCHQPPMTLSPKAARTVLLHMRVRALLPEDEQRRILQFLAP
jgi:cytochrome c5